MPTTVPIKLYRTTERANAAAKAAATEAGAGAAFGTRRLTAAGLVEELWELWGDGRALVRADERQVLMARAAAGCGAAETPGAPSVLAAFAAEHAAAFAEGIGRDGDGLAPLQRELVACLRSYYDDLSARNLIEPDAAAGRLASMVAAGRLPAMEVAVLDFLDASEGLRSLLAALGARAEGAAGLATVPPLPRDVQPSVLIAAGAAAMPELLLGVITYDGDAAESTLVVSADPAGLLRVLGASLAAAGFQVALRGAVPWDATALGRAWECVRRLEEGSPHWLAAATDFAYNPLSGLDDRKAREINGRLRADRLLLAEDAAGILAAESRSYEALVRVVRAMARGESVPSDALEALSGIVGSAFPGALERAVERAALDRLRALVQTAEELGASSRALLPMLADATVRIEGSSDGEGPVCEIAGTAGAGFPGAEKLGHGRPGGRQRTHLRHLRGPFGPGRPRRGARPSPRALGPSAPAVAVCGGWEGRAPPVRPGGEPPRRARGRVCSRHFSWRSSQVPRPKRRLPGPLWKGTGSWRPGGSAPMLRASGCPSPWRPRRAAPARERCPKSLGVAFGPIAGLRGASRADARPLAHPSASYAISRARPRDCPCCPPRPSSSTFRAPTAGSCSPAFDRRAPMRSLARGSWAISPTRSSPTSTTVSPGRACAV